jgi:poly(3-hydroxybutyrate) depolymerase
MKNPVSLLPVVALAALLAATGAEAARDGGEYTLVVEGYDWGPGVSRVILALDESVSAADAGRYTVSVRRSTECARLAPGQARGERLVMNAWVSDARGELREEGDHVTLLLGVAPWWPLGSPFQYSRNDRCRGNVWVDYAVTVTDASSGRVWDREAGRIIPIVDEFDLSGRFEHDGTTLTYASFAPAGRAGKAPLLIWLHGGGEGGTDPSIPLLANRATSYASEEIQTLFGGAHVLVPQTPGAWMHDAAGVMTHGREDDVYNAALMALIRDFVSRHPEIDADRVYVGGCSNGGYMALKLMLLHRDEFAAGFIAALAYQSQYLTDEQIASIAHLPIWFVHSADDGTTEPEKTVLPVYERLKAAGAADVHLSYYDHVVDVTGFFGGDGHRYNGHWSWVYLHADESRLDFDGRPVEVDGRPVSVMAWLAAQRRDPSGAKRAPR